MAIEMHRGILVGEKIVQLLMKDARLANVEGSIQAYQNGREQGYSLHVYAIGKVYRGIHFYFAENRNSDAIVVYESSRDCMQSISDEAYSNAEYFGYGCEEKAAEHIINRVLEFGGKTEDE